MAAQAVAGVECSRVSQVEPVHRRWEDTVLDVEDEVIVRAHQAVRHAGPPGPAGHACQVAKELEPVDIVAKELRDTPDTVREDVEHPGSRVSWRSGHRRPRGSPTSVAESEATSSRIGIVTWYRSCPLRTRLRRTTARATGPRSPANARRAPAGALQCLCPPSRRELFRLVTRGERRGLERAQPSEHTWRRKQIRRRGLGGAGGAS